MIQIDMKTAVRIRTAAKNGMPLDDICNTFGITAEQVHAQCGETIPQAAKVDESEPEAKEENWEE